MLQMMRTLLGQQLAGGTLSREELVALVKGTQTGAEGAVNDAQRTRDSALEVRASHGHAFDNIISLIPYDTKIDTRCLHQFIYYILYTVIIFF